MNKSKKELQPIKKTSDTTTTLQRQPSGVLPEGKIFHERICRVYGMKGEKLDHREESKLSRKGQTTMGHLRSGHHPELKH